jgi:hypothetical protein
MKELIFFILHWFSTRFLSLFSLERQFFQTPFFAPKPLWQQGFPTKISPHISRIFSFPTVGSEFAQNAKIARFPNSQI